MISTGPLSRTALSGVTLVGERRRVALVLPSREPLDVGVYGRLLGTFA
ncbi:MULTISPECIES: hypothetical protein [unclassified Streptomyces]|nr:hypothetical protein [Streptomyces sp. NBC_01445]WSE04141.1 hypothetical protein OG574_12695 [Streptomyces sp. NBC_01445]